jgi:hypothetical protein
VGVNQMKTTITIDMDESDFQQLYVSSMNWATVDWESQDGRLEPLPDYRKHARIYWFENYVELLIAKSFLSASGFESSTHFDIADESESYVLLTDFGGILQ